MKKPLLECCVDCVESALAAKKGGADRLELCANLIIGGTTPDINLYHRIRELSELRHRKVKRLDQFVIHHFPDEFSDKRVFHTLLHGVKS